MPLTRATAWDTYLALTRGLLPTLAADPADTAALTSQLSRVATRVARYAPLWGEHGLMLQATLRHAVVLDRTGRHRDLATLMRLVADRLYLLSAGPHPS